MDKYEAEKIVTQYGGIIASYKGGAARKKSLLPCSKAKLKMAYYIYIKSIIDHFGSIDLGLRNALSITYKDIDSFIDDEEADELNSIGLQISNSNEYLKSKSGKKRAEEYFNFVKKTTFNTEAIMELEEFISECLKR